MIDYLQALQCIQRYRAIRKTAVLRLRDAPGNICAGTISSSCRVPAFDNSAMDGFAVRAADTLMASPDNPLILPVAGSTVAGDAPSLAIAGSAWEITTGAAVPQGYDAIVIIEQVKIIETNASGRPARIQLSSPVQRTDHIRRAGEDFKPGDVLIEAGTRIMPQHIMALAASGISEIEINVIPKVTVISTGKELVDDDRTPLLPGQIRNANGPYLMAALMRMQVESCYAGVIPDDPDLFTRKLEELADRSDIILSTGAVSAGHHDFIPHSLQQLGAEIIFHKVAIRPGKPILFARLPNGVFYLGLPGNPISAAVGLRFFLYPLLCACMGIQPEQELKAKLEKPVQKKRGLRFFQKAFLQADEYGQRQLRILDGQESFKIRPMLEMNCWAILTEDCEYAAAGDPVTVASLYPGGLQ